MTLTLQFFSLSDQNEHHFTKASQLRRRADEREARHGPGRHWRGSWKEVGVQGVRQGLRCLGTGENSKLFYRIA